MKKRKNISFQKKHIFIYSDNNKNKWVKSKPNIEPIRHELHLFAATVRKIRNKKAAKICKGTL